MMRALWPIALSKGQHVAVEWEDGERTGQVEEVCASTSDVVLSRISLCSRALATATLRGAPLTALIIPYAWCHAGAHSVDQ